MDKVDEPGVLYEPFDSDTQVSYWDHGLHEVTFPDGQVDHRKCRSPLSPPFTSVPASAGSSFAIGFSRWIANPIMWISRLQPDLLAGL